MAPLDASGTTKLSKISENGTAGRGKSASGKTVRGRCPHCKKPTEQKWRPFCSRRCSDLDLGKWLSGSYVIAGGNADAEEDSMPDMSQLDTSEPE